MSKKRKYSRGFTPPSSGRKRQKTSTLSFSGRRSYSGGKVSRGTLPRPSGPRPVNPSFGARLGNAVLQGAVGLAVANVPGAVYGAYRGWNQFTQQKMKDTNKIKGGSAGSLGYQRSSMVVKGKKAKLKKTKVVKVSKYLRTAIKEVSKSATATGYYTRIFTGCVGSAIGNAGNFSLLSTSGFGSGNVAVFGPSFNFPAGSRSLFNNLCTYRASPLPMQLVNGADLNFFTPAKILHAASLLFNGKVENVDPTVTAGNLTTIMNSSTGLPITSDPGSLKVDIKKSWVKFNMKNVSDRVVIIDIWELGSILKFQTNNPLDSLVGAQYNTLDNIGAANSNSAITYWTQTAPGTIIQPGNVIFDGNINGVGLLQKNGFQWKGKHREMTLQPDETCVHNVVGPSGVLDYAKLNNDTLDQSNAFYKGFSVGCIISVRGDQAIRSGTAAVSQGQRDAYSNGVDAGVMGMPVAIETSENYMLSVPEVAGFMFPQLGAIGAIVAPQPLNFRKNKRIVSNFTPINGSSVAANNLSSVSNSTNPLLEQAGGQDQ